MGDIVESYYLNDENENNDSDKLKCKPLQKKKKRNRQYEGFNGKLINSAVYDEELMERIFQGIVQNIELEMQKKNISNSELSNLTGLSPSSLSKIFSYNVNISIKTLIKIAYALDVSPASLLPLDMNERKTNGQIFDDLTKPLDLQSVNYLLDTVAKFAALETGKIKNLEKGKQE